MRTHVHFFCILALSFLQVTSVLAATSITDNVGRRRMLRLRDLKMEQRTATTREDPANLYLRLRSRTSTRRAGRIVVPTKKSMQPPTFDTRIEARRKARLQDAPLPLSIEMRNAINFERAKLGLGPLRLHPLLELSAQKYAEDIVARNFFSHTDPEGTTIKNRINKTGYSKVKQNEASCICAIKILYGENIAKGQVSVAQVVRDWMGSTTGHREAILSTTYNEIGVGQSGDVWVLHFGGIEIIPVE